MNFGDSKKGFLITVLLLALIYLFSEIIFLDKITKIMVDEPWYSNTAFNFSKGLGFINTNVGSGGGDELFLFPFFTAVFYKIFGVSLWVSRFVSVIAGLISLITLLLSLRHLKIDARYILIIGVIFIYSNVFFIIFRTARPESFIIMFALLSLLFLFKFDSNSKFLNSFLSGFFAACSFLTHPHGLLFLLLFGLYFIRQSFLLKKVYPFIFFLIGTLPIFTILFLNILLFRQENIIVFFANWFARTSLNGSFLSIIIDNFVKFISTYTLGIKRLYIFLFEVSILLWGIFSLKKNKKVFFIPLMGFGYFVLAIILLKPFATRHFSEIIIFSIITLGVLLNNYKDSKTPQRILSFMVMLYFLNNFAGEIYLFSRDYKITSYGDIEKQIDEAVPDGTKVLTHLQFWYPLKNNDIYTRYTRWKFKEYKNLDDLMCSGDIDFVVLSDYLTRSGTATSGRKETKEDYSLASKFYKKALNYAKDNTSLLTTLKTNGYGEIQIYKVKK